MFSIKLHTSHQLDQCTSSNAELIIINRLWMQDVKKKKRSSVLVVKISLWTLQHLTYTKN